MQSNAKKSRQKQFPVIVFPQNVILKSDQINL
jgi:hypothetical protein